VKRIENVIEWIIIVVAFIVLVIPEIAYSCLLRARDFVIDMMGNYKSYIKIK